MASVEEVAKTIAIIKAGCARADDMRPETERLYAKRLQDEDGRLLEAAALHLVETFVPTSARPFPTLAEIKQAMRTLVPDGRPDPESVWGDVLRQIRDVGYTATPKFSDPLVARAVHESVGWCTLCTATADQMVSHRARLIDCYTRILDRVRFEETLAPRARQLVREVKTEREARRIGGPVA